MCCSSHISSCGHRPWTARASVPSSGVHAHRRAPSYPWCPLVYIEVNPPEPTYRPPSVSPCTHALPFPPPSSIPASVLVLPSMALPSSFCHLSCLHLNPFYLPSSPLVVGLLPTSLCLSPRRVLFRRATAAAEPDKREGELGSRTDDNARARGPHKMRMIEVPRVAVLRSRGT
ncbi:hypothetical protein K523DRAFT_150452 [Schizophyllum commune Tattone D]|nr:hypothetical protein K523DRAFT_150452 [Schizophyllum commune Tattone D]